MSARISLTRIISTSGSRRPVTALRLSVVAGLLATTAGCAVMSPTQTNVPYEPADGFSGNIGTVKARSLVVVSTGKEAPALVTGGLVNDSERPVKLVVRTQAQADADAGKGTSSGAVIHLAGHQQLSMKDVQLPTTGVAPGGIIKLSITSDGDAGTVLIEAPVLAPTGPFATFTPTHRPTTSTPTPSSTR